MGDPSNPSQIKKKTKSKTHHYKPIKKDPVVGGSDGMAADGKSVIVEVMV